MYCPAIACAGHAQCEDDPGLMMILFPCTSYLEACVLSTGLRRVHDLTRWPGCCVLRHLSGVQFFFLQHV